MAVRDPTLRAFTPYFASIGAGCTILEASLPMIKQVREQQSGGGYVELYMGPALIAILVLLIFAIGTTVAVVFRGITRRREQAEAAASIETKRAA